MQIELKIPLCSIGRRPLKQWAASPNANEVMKHFMGRPGGLEGVRGPEWAVMEYIYMYTKIYILLSCGTDIPTVI